jgi:hypothetical protein
MGKMSKYFYEYVERERVNDARCTPAHASFHLPDMPRSDPPIQPRSDPPIQMSGRVLTEDERKILAALSETGNDVSLVAKTFDPAFSG